MADLYTHHYRKENPSLSNEVFSPIAVAIDYYFNDWLTSWAHRLRNIGKGDSVISHEGGLPSFTASTGTSGFGICLESAVRTPDALVRHIQNIERIARMRQEAYGSGEISEEESQQLVNRVRSCSGVEESLHAVFLRCLGTIYLKF